MLSGIQDRIVEYSGEAIDYGLEPDTEYYVVGTNFDSVIVEKFGTSDRIVVPGDVWQMCLRENYLRGVSDRYLP